MNVGITKAYESVRVDDMVAIKKPLFRNKLFRSVEKFESDKSSRALLIVGGVGGFSR